MSILNNQIIKYLLVFLCGWLFAAVAMYRDSDVAREKQLVLSYEDRMSKKEAEIEQLRFLQQEKVSRLEKEKFQMETSFKEKVQALVTENQSLKKSVEKVVIETRRPDGTVEKKTISKEILEKESQKIAQLQKEVDKKIIEVREAMKTEYEDKLIKMNKAHQLEKQELTVQLEQVNRSYKESVKYSSRYSLGVGKKNDFKNIAIAEYNFYGPLFMGSLMDFKNTKYDTIGLVLGVRF